MNPVRTPPAALIAVLVVTGCPNAVDPPARTDPPPGEDSKEPTNDEAPTTTPANAHMAQPTPVPPHLAAMRRKLEMGHVGLALKLADDLLEAHPNDPWVLADVGYAKQAMTRERSEGELLPRALELAEDPSLRAQILLYQARLAQQRDGLPAGRALLERSLAEFELPESRRNLQLIDAHMSEESPSADAAARIERSCARILADTASKIEFKTCVGAQIGDTTWVRETSVFDDMSADLRVFHNWHLVDPAPANPEGFRVDLGGDEEDVVHHYSPCRSSELVMFGGVYGGEGRVVEAKIEAKIATHEGDDHLVVQCREDKFRTESDGMPLPQAPSFYVMVCDMETGWCSDKVYTFETLADGSFREAEVKAADGKFIITRPGEKPDIRLWP